MHDRKAISATILAKLAPLKYPVLSGLGVMLRTRLCELLGIDVPIFGAPTGPEILGIELAAAISNAGERRINSDKYHEPEGRARELPWLWHTTS